MEKTAVHLDLIFRALTQENIFPQPDSNAVL
jgi:hypothetical protein